MARPQAASEECIFCARPEINEEHIFGRKWLAKVFELPRGERLRHHHTRGDAEREHFDEWWNAKEANFAVRCVCPKCNSGWMNVLDERAQRVIQPLLSGEPARLATWRDQYTLAMWLCKLAFMFDYMRDEAVVAIATARAFHDSRTPPSSVRIWLACAPPLPGYYHASGLTWDIREPGGPADSYLCVIRVQSLVALLALPFQHSRYPSWFGYPDAVLPFWPLTLRAIEWPTQKVLDDVEFALTVDAFVLSYQAI